MTGIGRVTLSVFGVVIFIRIVTNGTMWILELVQ